MDSSDGSANYIHIDDVKDNIEYYCPCCKGIIKPRAYKKDINYQVQPHFYHETGGCNEETFVHYICKTWLFEKGCKFIVNNTEYEVEDVSTEKTLHTSFGDYRPDIIVTTVSGKIFYFEIRATNRKTEHHIPKWDELGNDVVEVDTRYFINQKCKNNIPVFNLIYSNGDCFIKTYTRNDYDNTIAERKLQWKRQDKLNYKIQWERLDWFWNAMQKYKNNELGLDSVFEFFKCLDIFDKEICFDLLKKQTCIKSNNQDFRNIINDEAVEYWNNNAKNIIQNKIEFGSCIIRPRNQIIINYHYIDAAGFEQHRFNSFSNQEWIIRPSKLTKIINSIKLKITHDNELIMKKQQFNDIVAKVINDISKLFTIDKCIWYFKFKNVESFEVGIKNGYNSFHEFYYLITYNNFDNGLDSTYEDIYSVFLDKIIKGMNKIHKHILTYDGINSEYRHVFLNREVNKIG